MTTTDPRRVSHGRLLATALVLTASTAPPVMLTGALAVRIQTELGIGEAALGAAISAYFVAGGVLATVLGNRIDRMGWHRGAHLASAVSAVSLLGVAGLAHAWWSLTLFLVLGGLSFALAMPAGNLLLAREMPSHRLGLTFGVKQTAVPLAALFAGLAVPAFALAVGWRWAFVAALVFPLAASLLIPPVDAVAASRPAQREEEPTWDGPSAELIALAVAGAAGMGAATVLAAFLVATAVGAGLGEGAAGLLLAAASLLGLTVRAASGWLVDRTDSDGLRPVATMLLLGAVGYLLLSVDHVAAVAIGGLVAFGAGWGWTGLFFFGVVRTHLDAPGAATGTLLIGMAPASAVAPLAFGAAADQVGFTGPWIAMAVLTAVAGALVARVAHRRGGTAHDGITRTPG